MPNIKCPDRGDCIHDLRCLLNARCIDPFPPCHCDGSARDGGHRFRSSACSGQFVPLNESGE